MESSKAKVAVLTTGDKVIYQEQPNGWKDPLLINKDNEGKISFFPVAEYGGVDVMVLGPVCNNILFVYDAEEKMAKAREQFLGYLKEAHTEKNAAGN